MLNEYLGPNNTIEYNPDPFEKIRIRWLLLLLIISQLGIFTFIKVSQEIPIEGYVGQLILIIWAFIIIRKHNVSMSKLIGKIPNDMNWLPIFGLTITLLIYAIGAIAVVIFPIFTLDQNFATKILETGNNYSPIHTLILGIFIAPAVEEIIFRGFLMNRIGRKFGIKAGIILSSAIFALGHSIFFLGAFVIGITFCLIYIKTKTLIVPMTAHIFYNSLVWLAGLASQDIGGFSSEYWIQFIYQGLIAMTITSPIIFITMIRWWPSNSTKIPYHSNR